MKLQSADGKPGCGGPGGPGRDGPRGPGQFAGSRWWGLGVGIFFTLMLIPIGVGVAEAMTGPERVNGLVLLGIYGANYLVLPNKLWRTAVL